ncbi:MAG: ribosomal protein S17, partial [Thermoguttaceae bacterium]|nr:ribosomal protein S17 [Thermoguttaceae bacterium]
MPRRVAVGIVTGDKTAKTRRVEIARLVRHPKYGKTLRHRTVCYVH